ncbi:MAG: YjbQ family protein [Bacteroidales bacterium]|nr:YjbQ family protein [Bacteroidales bacterium]
MQQSIHISTPAHNELYDITRQVEALVSESAVKAGLVNVYARGATAGILMEFYLIGPL